MADQALETIAQRPADLAVFGAAVVAAGGVMKRAPYLGQVATRTHMADTVNTANTTSIQRHAHVMRDDVTSLQFVLGNFYCTTSGEAGRGGAVDVRLWLEYPEQTYTPITVNGSTAIALADGAAQVVTDKVTITIPRGAVFWVQTWQSSSAGILFASAAKTYAGIGDRGSIGTAVPATPLAPTGGSAGGFPWGPYAIIATATRPSVACIGDSKGFGTGQTANATGYVGEIEPSLAPTYGYLDLSRGSQQAQQVTSGGFTRRATYLQYVTHAVCQIGRNDVSSGGRTAVQVATDRQAIRALAPSLTWFETTVGPSTTSTDGWVTLENQTVLGTENQRKLFNENVRLGSPGFAGYFDVADGNESSRNSGKWKVPPQVPVAQTADGVHQNDAGYPLTRPYVDPKVIA